MGVLVLNVRMCDLRVRPGFGIFYKLAVLVLLGPFYRPVCARHLFPETKGRSLQLEACCNNRVF